MTTPAVPATGAPTGDQWPASPARVTVAGDWHGNTRWAVAAIGAAAQAGSSVVVHTGDFGFWGGAAGASYLDAVARALREHDLVLLWVDGNHEDHERLAALPVDERGMRPVRPRMWHVPRGARWSWSGLVWMGLGGAVSVDRNVRTPGRDWWAQEVLSAADMARADVGGRCDVLVTHDCPDQVVDLPLGPSSRWPADALRSADAHRAALGAVAARVSPTHLFHGHYHVRYSRRVLLPGGGCRVEGLDCDGLTLRDNLLHLVLADLAAESVVLRRG